MVPTPGGTVRHPLQRALVLGLPLLLVVLASSAEATKYAGAFMMDGGGARALGMGSAFVAVADDASATFWNPAGLAGQSRRQLLVMHSERFGDLVDRDFVSYVHPLRGETRQALGFTVIRLGLDDIPFTDHLVEVLDTDGNGELSDEEAAQIFSYRDEIRYESDQEWAFMGSYAREVGAWQIGGNVKVIRQSVGDYSSFGLGIDLGVLRRDWWKRLDFGMKFQDATSTYLSWSTGTTETIAPVLVPGVSYDWSLAEANLEILASCALETHFDNRNGEVPAGRDDGGVDGVDQFSWSGLGLGSVSSNLHLGLELRLSRRVDLRVGSHGGFSSEDWTFGAGLDLRPLRVDYAFAGDELGFDDSSHYTHRVSLGVGF
jgi:hypothetical protein